MVRDRAEKLGVRHAAPSRIVDTPSELMLLLVTGLPRSPLVTFTRVQCRLPLFMTALTCANTSGDHR